MLRYNYLEKIDHNYYYTIIGAAGAYAVGHLHYDWKKIGDIIFTLGTFVLALLLLIIYYCNSLWILYILYIMFGTCYQVLLTITTYDTITGNFSGMCKCKSVFNILKTATYLIFF